MQDGIGTSLAVSLTLLSQNAIELGSQWKRTWKSTFSLTVGPCQSQWRHKRMKRVRNLAEQELKNRIALRFREADDAARET